MRPYSILLFLFLWIGLSGVAQTIYISPSGDDKNQGTSSHPLASLEGARNKINEMRRAGSLNDTVWVKIQGGTYYLQQPFVLGKDDSGTKESPIVFQGDNDDRPLFCGGMEVGPFQVVSPRLWKVYIPEVARYGFSFEQLYVNGERRYRAQTPNRGEFYRIKRVEETVLDTSGVRIPVFASQKVVFHDADKGWLADITDKERSDALVVFYHNWDNTRKRIMNINTKDTAIYIAGGAMKPWNRLNDKSRYVVENYAKALDAPGEWFLSRDGWLHYIPMPGEKPENTSCIVPVTERFLTIAGKEGQPVEHISFVNLRFEAASYITPRFGNEPSQAAAPVEATIMMDYANHINFLNCDVAHTGLNALWFRNNCSYGRVEHCHLHDLGGGGVKIGTTTMPADDAVTNHIVVHNNIIQHGGYVFPCAVGVIVFNGCDNEITHNEIADFRYSGVSVGWVWGYAHSPSKRNKVEFNHIHHLGWAELCDMGGIYTLAASEGTTVNNNVIHHIYSFNYGGWGLYTDEGSYDVHMENNLVYNCKNAGFHQHYGKENVIRNNIFANNLLSQMQFTRVEEHRSLSFTNNIIYYTDGLLYMSMGKERWQKANLAVDYNCYWNAAGESPIFDELSFADWKKLGRDSHSIIADPLFVNPEQADFRFRKQSTAKKIKFKPFDYSKAGVYGSPEWLKKAEMPRELLEAYDSAVERLMNKD